MNEEHFKMILDFYRSMNDKQWEIMYQIVEKIDNFRKEYKTELIEVCKKTGIAFPGGPIDE